MNRNTRLQKWNKRQSKSSKQIDKHYRNKGKHDGKEKVQSGSKYSKEIKENSFKKCEIGNLL